MLTVVTPAASPLLTTLAAVRAELQLTATTDDTHLTSLIASASAAITAACGRTGFGAEAIVQVDRITSPRQCVILARTLVPVIASVLLDATALTPSSTPGWELDGGLLYLLSGTARIVWPRGSVVTITYTAGYALPDGAPADLARAAVLTVSAWYAARGRDPLLRSETTDGVGSASWVATDATGALPPQVTDMLQSWRLLSI